MNTDTVPMGVLLTVIDRRFSTDITARELPPYNRKRGRVRCG